MSAYDTPLFRSKVRNFGPRFMRDVVIDKIGCAAFFGNFGQETGGFALRGEVGKKSKSTQGWGWAQWTGSRRVDLEKYCNANGLKPYGNEEEYDEACYRFAVHELKNTWERRAIVEIQKPNDALESEVNDVMRLYERPGVKHEERRVAWARTALDELHKAIASAPIVTPMLIGVKGKPMFVSTSLRSSTKHIVVHCTATRPNQPAGAKEVHQWHIARGWAGIGYHYVIRRDGTIETGRSPDNSVGAHVGGHNYNTVGVSLEGGLAASNGKPENNFTTAQFASLKSLCLKLQTKYPGATILGHRDLSPDKDGDGIIQENEWLKACPCFEARAWANANGLLAAPGGFKPPSAENVVKGVAIAGTAVAGTVVAKEPGLFVSMDWTTMALIGLVGILVLVLAFFLIRWLRTRKPTVEVVGNVPDFQQGAGLGALESEAGSSGGSEPFKRTTDDPGAISKLTLLLLSQPEDMTSKGTQPWIGQASQTASSNLERQLLAQRSNTPVPSPEQLLADFLAGQQVRQSAEKPEQSFQKSSDRRPRRKVSPVQSSPTRKALKPKSSRQKPRTQKR